MAESFNVRLVDLLRSTGEELVERLDADACAISRAIGDVLIMVTSVSPEGQMLQLGAGYLVSDYPLTRRVMETGQACSLTLQDPDLDPKEAAVLRDLGYASLLMLSLDLSGGRWGLVSVYRTSPRPFGEREQRLGAQIVGRAGTRTR